MAVDGTEVAVPVDQRIPQREILRHAHHGVVYRGVAVRMIPAQHGAHRVGALAVCLIGGQVVLVHGVEDPAVHRLEPVPHIRQGAGNDDRHGVFEEAFLHLLLQIHRYHFHLRRLFFHCVTIPFRVALRLQIPARETAEKPAGFKGPGCGADRRARPPCPLRPRGENRGRPGCRAAPAACSHGCGYAAGHKTGRSVSAGRQARPG